MPVSLNIVEKSDQSLSFAMCPGPRTNSVPPPKLAGGEGATGQLDAGPSSSSRSKLRKRSKSVLCTKLELMSLEVSGKEPNTPSASAYLDVAAAARPTPGRVVAPVLPGKRKAEDEPKPPAARTNRLKAAISESAQAPVHKLDLKLFQDPPECADRLGPTFKRLAMENMDAPVDSYMTPGLLLSGGSTRSFMDEVCFRMGATLMDEGPL